MPNIRHRIIINSSPKKIYLAASTLDGLKQWWTRDALLNTSSLEIGTLIQFRFGDGGPDMRVLKLAPGKEVVWECVGGTDDWIGTQFQFLIEEKEGKTILFFSQTGWKEESEFFAHCNCRWAYFMLSMKLYLEQGKGTPYPEAIEM